MNKKMLSVLMLLVPLFGWAQQSVSGIVYDLDNKKVPLQQVKVKNLSSNKHVITKGGGLFTVEAKVGDLLELSLNGFHTDTLYLIDLSPKKIYLPGNSTNLKEVEIVSVKVSPDLIPNDPGIKPVTRIETDGLRGKKNNDRAGGLKFNLGYGKFKRQQEKVKQMEEQDFYESEINAVFTERYVEELVKLKGQDLKDFMSLYRPSAVLVKSERPFNYAYYTVKAYHTWLKLSPTERKVPAVPKLKRN